MQMLLAGVGRQIINPPLGVKTFGFSSREGTVQAIESDLSATALVLADGENKIAIVAVDTGWLAYATATDLRRRLSEAIGTPPSHILVNLNHTHSSSSMPEWVPDEPDQMAMQARHRDDLCDRVVKAVQDAEANLHPARIGSGWGDCDIGVYRREMGADGIVFLGEVPDHPIDTSVGVIRLDDLDGNPIATLFSYGCHPVVVGPRSFVASPDFPGAARDVIESSLGGTAMFLQACGGNIMPAGGMGYEVDCRDSKKRIGSILGGEVLKTSAAIRTNVTRGERTRLGSLSNISLWPWVPVSGGSCAALSGADEIVSLDYIAMPSLDAAKRNQEQYHRIKEEAKTRSARESELNVATRFADWSDKLVEAIETDRRGLDLVVQALRINDIALVGLSAEAFFETGMTLKSRSPIPHPQVLGYSNGCVCYLPRAEDYPPGGWNWKERYGVPDMLFQAYSLPVALHQDSERRVVDRAEALLQKLA